MNLKPLIAWTFVAAFAFLLLYFLLSKLVDCSSPNIGLWQGLNPEKSSFCSFIKAIKAIACGGFLFGSVITLINYFVFNDKETNY